MLLEDLAQAEAKLQADRRTAVAAEDLVGSLELEVADIEKQIALVQARSRAALKKAAAEKAKARAAQISSQAAATAHSETVESGGGGSE